MAERKTNSPPDKGITYGGILGGVLPLVVMILAMILLAVNGMRSTMNFWSAGFLAVIAGFFVYKDKAKFQEALISGIRDKILGVMILIFLLAGVLSKILSASHVVQGMLWASSQMHLSPGLVPLICFIVSALLSTATGSAASSVGTLTPIMVPMALAMGGNIGVVCGSILSGAAFGDNLAPISDTTIASSLTQEVSVIRVVRSRLKYSLIGGAAAAVLFLIVGMKTVDSNIAQTMASDGSYASSLVFLIIPILIIVLMLKKANFFTALIISEVVGFVMLFAFGFVSIGDIVAKDGLIVSAFSGMIGSIIFIIFIFLTVSLIRDAGVLDALLETLRKYAKSDRTAEVVSGGMVCVMSIAISSGTSAITFCGPIIRSLLRPFKIDRARAANFLDGLGCGIGYLVPTNAGCMVLASLAVASGAVAEGFNSIEFIGYNFYSMALVVIYWFAILSGWGRTHETDEELAADGIIVEPA
jgi:Na+/H+ antiporter NhaC